MNVVTAQQMKEMDRLTIESVGIPGIVLMENAGRGCVDSLLRHFPDVHQMTVGVIAGRGNNGGDGFVIARYLASRKIDVSVFLLAERGRVKGDARINLDLLDQIGVPVLEVPDEATLNANEPRMNSCSLWVDAMLGTGLKAKVRGLFKTCIEWLNIQQKPIVAVDMPSGLDSDTGRPCGCCIQATLTVTFGFPKIGHVVLPGADLVGRVEVVDIGIPPAVVDWVGPQHYLLTRENIQRTFKPRPSECHKGTTGHLLVIGGSPGKSGAAAMTSQAAMRVGAGLVTLGIPKSLNSAMESSLTEVMTVPLPETADETLGLSAFNKIKTLLVGKKALAIGPGLGTGKAAANLVTKLMASTPVPVVVDADGLNGLVGATAFLKGLKVPVVMTPHPGEMARLVGKTSAHVQQDRIGVARRFAEKHRVHLILKGARTVIAHPDGSVGVNPTGNPGMASGGMGDVLTGMIAGFLVQGMSASEATEAAVYLHGAAADSLVHGFGPMGFLASDIIGVLPQQIKALGTAIDVRLSSANPLITAL